MKAMVVNAIRKEERDKEVLLRLSYQDHLWLEKEIKTVANVTHLDIAEFLPLAAQVPLRPQVQTYPLAEANRALLELKQGPVRGAKVLLVGPRTLRTDPQIPVAMIQNGAQRGPGKLPAIHRDPDQSA